MTRTASTCVTPALLALAVVLAGCRERGQAEAPRITAARVPLGSILNDPEAAFWRGVLQARVTVLPQSVVAPTIREPAVGALLVRAAHDGELLAVRLEWSDSSESHVTGVDRFGDQVAVEFPVNHTPEVMPSPMMGHQGAPVRILQWRSELQWELAHGRPRIQDLYPNAVVDLYPDSLLGGEVAAPYTGGRAVGNPVAQPRLLSPVIAHIAEGFGTLTDAVDQQANGTGTWRNRRWHVVITHPLDLSGPEPKGLRPGLETVIGFAVWDGGHNEVGSRKGWAGWLPFMLEP